MLRVTGRWDWDIAKTTFNTADVRRIFRKMTILGINMSAHRYANSRAISPRTYKLCSTLKYPNPALSSSLFITPIRQPSRLHYKIKAKIQKYTHIKVPGTQKHNKTSNQHQIKTASTLRKQNHSICSLWSVYIYLISYFQPTAVKVLCFKSDSVLALRYQKTKLFPKH